MSGITMDEVHKRIDGLPPETQKAIVCALVGHSRIQAYCFGYWSCGRCEEQVGDSLGGSYNAEGCVIVRHLGNSCQRCRENYAALTWKDTFMAPDPFAPKQEVKP